jgi:hypothetical protein
MVSQVMLTTGAPSSPTSIATDHSLLELDSELDGLLDQIQDEIEDLKKIESHEFTLKRNKNPQDSVVITQPDSILDDPRRLRQRSMVPSGST